MLELLLFPVLMLGFGIAAGFLLARVRFPAAAVQETPQALADHAPQQECNLKQNSEALRQRAIALAKICHELRTPLNGVLGFTELLLAGDLEDGHRKQVQMISESGRSMLRLLNDILDIARLQSGKFRLVEEPTDLREDLQNCADMMTATAKPGRMSISCNVDPLVPDSIMLDRVRLREVMLCLLGNAVKFGEDGRIDVDARMTERDGIVGLDISVIDHGIGIPPERHEDVFVPFFDSSDQSEDRRNCAAMGLAIARQIIRHMGGDITLESTTGNGSIFKVHLPVVSAKAGLDEQAPDTLSAPSDTALPSACLGKPRVLVAEDNAINQQLIVAMLEKLEIKAALVSDGQQAVEAVEQARADDDPFDVVLMDVQMPQMDGLQATLQMRQSGIDKAELVVLALTANCCPSDVAACHAAGMQDHIAKPVRLADIAAKLFQHCGYQSADASQASGSNAHPSGKSSPELLPSAGELADAIDGLELKYTARKKSLLKLIEELLAEDSESLSCEQVIRELHKLAGIAASFGEAELGEISREVGAGMKSARQPAERQVLLSRAFRELKKAA